MCEAKEPKFKYLENIPWSEWVLTMDLGWLADAIRQLCPLVVLRGPRHTNLQAQAWNRFFGVADCRSIKIKWLEKILIFRGLRSIWRKIINGSR